MPSASSRRVSVGTGGLLACYVAATQPDRWSGVPSRCPITVERTAAEGPGVAAHGTVRVLIVDAHELMREGLVRLLSSTDGIEVVGEAAAGEEAVALAATLQPDVVLLDFILPDIDGVEVARRLLAASHRQILMLTSVGDGGIARRSRSA
jgi:CheY-like chemotaxis protein